MFLTFSSYLQLSFLGSTILWYYVFMPTTIAQTLTSPDILVILLAVCCIAVIGGVFIWFMERYTPESTFPKEFSSGVLAGVYWAVVSMATVGYGDKVPKSRCYSFPTLHIKDDKYVHNDIPSRRVGGCFYFNHGTL